MCRYCFVWPCLYEWRYLLSVALPLCPLRSLPILRDRLFNKINLDHELVSCCMGRLHVLTGENFGIMIWGKDQEGYPTNLFGPILTFQYLYQSFGDIFIAMFWGNRLFLWTCLWLFTCFLWREKNVNNN